jgi:O-antigen/teichoic acid export membrane protein
VVKGSANLRTLLALKGWMTLAVAGLCLGLIPLAVTASGLSGWWLVLCSIHFVGASWIELAGTALRALGRRRDEARVLVTFRLALLILVIAAPFGRDLDGVSRAYAVSTVPAFVLGAWLLRAALSTSEPGIASTLKEIATQAWPLGVNGFLSIVSTRVELFFLQGSGSAHRVGLLGGPLKVVESLLALPTAIVAGALPAVARDAVSGTRGAAQRTFGLVIWIALPSAVGLALCAPEVLAILGPGFVDGAPALRVLMIGLVCCFANVALFQVLIAASDSKAVPFLTGIRVAISFVASAIAIPVFGVIGGALSFSTAELGLFLALAIRCRRHVDLHVVHPLCRAALACLPMALILFIPASFLPVRIVAGAALFAGAAAISLRRGTAAAGLA